MWTTRPQILEVPRIYHCRYIIGPQSRRPYRIRKAQFVRCCCFVSPIGNCAFIARWWAEVADCESPETSSQYYISLLRMHVLEAATQREFEILEAVLPHTEHRWVPIEYYKAAHLSAKVLFQRVHMRKVSN